MSLRFLVAASCACCAVVLSAQERRAAAPKFDDQQWKQVFFESLDEAFEGDRPSLTSVRQKNQAFMVAASKAKKTTGTSNEGSDLWPSLISSTSIEDEVKRVRLHYDSVITTPGKFNSGGFQDARLDLTILATLFAVIADYSEDIRWKKDAPAARDLIARTAFNCKAGSNQVFNEAKLRKGDLQDLLSGTGLSTSASVNEDEEETDWSMIADRSPLMEYAEELIEALEDEGRDAETIESNSESIRRRAELLAVLGEVLTKEGMDDAGDEDYDQLSRDMTTSSRSVVAALERADLDSVRKGISDIRTRCDSCHEQYR